MNRSAPSGRRRGVRLAMALILASVAAGGVYFYASSLQHQVALQAAAAATPAPSTPVVVAKFNIPAKTPLTRDSFEVRQMLRTTVQPNAVVSLDALQGKVLNAPVLAGQQLVSTELVDAKDAAVKSLADMIPPGKRAISLDFTDRVGAGGLIVPGNYVDVVGVFEKGTLGKDQSMILLQDALVLAVAQNTSADQLPLQSSAKPAPTAAPAVPLPGAKPTPAATPAAAHPRVPVAPPETRTVTLAVAPEAAERLALAEADGHLSYTIRPTGDHTQNAVLPADLGTLASPIEATKAQIIATEISPTNAKVGDTLTVKITVKNVSDKPLQTMDPQPGFTYVQGQTYYTQQFPSQPGKWRVAIGTAGLDSTQLPYRWGLGGDLAPGATTTVTGQIKLTADFKPTNFYAAVVDEPSDIVQNNVGTTLVTSLPENTAVVAVDAANARSGPSISSSVVTQVPYGTQLQIVGHNADWFKVKLPDQTVAWMAAGWIVTAGR